MYYEELEQEYRELFEEIDTDGNGYLSREEFLVFLKNDGEEYDEEEMEEMNELFDEDGHITFETFFALFSDVCDDDDEQEE